VRIQMALCLRGAGRTDTDNSNTCIRVCVCVCMYVRATELHITVHRQPGHQ